MELLILIVVGAILLLSKPGQQTAGTIAQGSSSVPSSTAARLPGPVAILNDPQAAAQLAPQYAQAVTGVIDTAAATLDHAVTDTAQAIAAAAAPGFVTPQGLPATVITDAEGNSFAITPMIPANPKYWTTGGSAPTPATTPVRTPVFVPTPKPPTVANPVPKPAPVASPVVKPVVVSPARGGLGPGGHTFGRRNVSF